MPTICSAVTHFLPAWYMELAAANRPMAVYPFEVGPTEPEQSLETVEALLQSLLTAERRGLRRIA